MSAPTRWLLWLWNRMLILIALLVISVLAAIPVTLLEMVIPLGVGMRGIVYVATLFVILAKINFNQIAEKITQDERQ